MEGPERVEFQSGERSKQGGVGYKQGTGPGRGEVKTGETSRQDRGPSRGDVQADRGGLQSGVGKGSIQGRGQPGKGPIEGGVQVGSGPSRGEVHTGEGYRQGSNPGRYGNQKREGVPAGGAGKGPQQGPCLCPL